MSSKKVRGRELDGILLLDKPTGISSNGALQKALRLFGARKAGHTGSLDPLASGMLPVCFGEATKVSTYLLESDKAYSVSAQLGVSTDTCDSDGEIVDKRAVPDIAADEIEQVLSGFRGGIAQVPPMYSALKHKGQRLYKLARKGQQVERRPRDVHINELKLLDFSDSSFSLHVECSKGTYIRSLVADIGEAIGCGAHVTRLRREWVSPFSTHAMHSFSELEVLLQRGTDAIDRCLLPIDTGLSLPVVVLDNDTGQRLLMGQVVTCAEANSPETVYCVRDENRRFLGVGVCTQTGVLAPKRLIRTYFDQ